MSWRGKCNWNGSLFLDGATQSLDGVTQSLTIKDAKSPFSVRIGRSFWYQTDAFELAHRHRVAADVKPELTGA
jgi:hypothetical protein